MNGHASSNLNFRCLEFFSSWKTLNLFLALFFLLIFSFLESDDGLKRKGLALQTDKQPRTAFYRCVDLIFIKLWMLC